MCNKKADSTKLNDNLAKDVSLEETLKEEKYRREVLSKSHFNCLDFNRLLAGKRAPKNAKKDGKPPLSILPMDILGRYLTPAMVEGLEYGRESWRVGLPISECIDAIRRHELKFWEEGEDYDKESAKKGVKKHHLAGIIAHAIFALNTLEKRPEFDDRPLKTLYTYLRSEVVVDDDKEEHTFREDAPE